MTLWCIARSPLMFGGDIPSLDPFTLSLLTNDEVLEVHGNSERNRQLFARGDAIAWCADVPGSSDKFVAVFNLGDVGAASIEVDIRGLDVGAHCSIRDLWVGRDLGEVPSRFAAVIPAHGAGLYRIGS